MSEKLIAGETSALAVSKEKDGSIKIAHPSGVVQVLSALNQSVVRTALAAQAESARAMLDEFDVMCSQRPAN